MKGRPQRILFAAIGVGLIILAVGIYSISGTINKYSTSTTNQNNSAKNQSATSSNDTDTDGTQPTQNQPQDTQSDNQDDKPQHSEPTPTASEPTRQQLQFNNTVYLPVGVTIPDLTKPILSRKVDSTNITQYIIDTLKEISLEQNSLKVTANNSEVFYIIGDPVYVYRVRYKTTPLIQTLQAWPNEHSSATQKYECDADKQLSSKNDPKVAWIECKPFAQREGMEGEWYPTGEVVVCGIEVQPTGTVIVEPFLRPTDSKADACSKVEIK